MILPASEWGLFSTSCTCWVWLLEHLVLLIADICWQYIRTNDHEIAALFTIVQVMSSWLCIGKQKSNCSIQGDLHTTQWYHNACRFIYMFGKFIKSVCVNSLNCWFNSLSMYKIQLKRIPRDILQNGYFRFNQGSFCQKIL